MRILWSIHLYPPRHNCGSEVVAHNVNKFLISRGHQVRVILHQDKMHNIHTPYNYEGVEVIGSTGHVESYRWADAIMTHLDFTQFSIIMAHEVKKPLFHFVHNDTTYTSVQSAPSRNFVVYNSRWIGEKINYPHSSFVLHPPCDMDYYNVCEDPINNEYITLINLDQNKGGKILREVAKAMPDRKFLGVIGGYSSPAEVGQIRDQPGNVKVIPNTPHILEVYKKTRVLLMPSAYESWGRTATEAMCNGIPVICTPTPGLKENCADAGIYIPPRDEKFSMAQQSGEVFSEEEVYDINPILREIKKLDSVPYYKIRSEKCRQRAKELKPDMEAFERFLYDSCYR